MKKSDIQKQLKMEADKYTPDPLESIKREARAQNLLPDGNGQNEEIYSVQGTAVKAKSKRKTVGMLTALSAFIVCIALVLSFTLPGVCNSNVTFNGLSAENVYGMGAVTTAKLLGNSVSAEAISTLSAVRASSTAKGEDDVKAQAEKFNEYFSALDSFLGEDIVSTSTSDNTDESYPYDTKMIVSGMDFSGQAVTYVMYYTETLVKTKTDRNEVKSVFSLEGVMVIDGTDYFLEGEREEETERNERETELKIRAYADLSDKSSYVQMKQEYSVENNETETQYVYSVYSNGKLIEQTAVEFEKEIKNGKVETEYELEFISGSAKGKYKVEREVKNNVAEIKVQYDIDGVKGEFRINEIADADGVKEYEYLFGDNSKLIFKNGRA